MKVSFFESVKHTAPKVSKDVSHFLERIRVGKSRDLVEKIRTESDKDKQQELKIQLPGVCFNGHFTQRSKAGLKKASGLMVLDFDDFATNQEALDFKTKLQEDNHIYSAWLSPRMGVKALYKIPTVKDDNEFKDIYEQVSERYTNLDSSGKDISRFCYESADPNIYINLDAETFIPEVREKEMPEIGEVTNLPLQDQDEIAERLEKWFNSHYDRSQRNNSVFKLAAAFNDFGVPKSTAENYCFRYAEKGFSTREIGQILDSAYKKTSQFGTKFFEDARAKKKLTNLVMTGKSSDELSEQFPDFDKSKLESEIEAIKESVKLDEFWRYDDKGKVKIVPYKLKFYLESINFFKYYPVKGKKEFVFIEKEENFLDNTNEFAIKDTVLNNLLVRGELDVFDTCADNSKLFTESYLSLLNTADVDTEKDGEDFAYLYYQNTAVKVTKEGVKLIPYDELDGYVWKNQVVNRDYIEADHHESMFRTFVWLIAGQEKARYNTMKSVIGYLLHSHKTSANNKAIILNDEVISDTPNGGSGKGLLTSAIGKMKKVTEIDGKTHDFKDKFAYQTVSSDCQVLAFDDVKKNFKFENLFSVITQGITIEYKGLNAERTPVEDSPKVLISTNYTIKAEGGSFERRMFEVELSSYFGAHHTPLDEFGCMLFDDWSKKEWARFDQYMINCVQYYLENGLVPYELKNLKIRKIINQTNQEFFDWMESFPLPVKGERVNYREKYNDFIKQNEEFISWLKPRGFNKWLGAYYDFKGVKWDSKPFNGVRYYEILNGKEVEPSGLGGFPEVDVDDVF